MPHPHPTRTFIRLVRLQDTAWRHGHKRWARDIGSRLREMRSDYPQLREFDSI